MNLLADTSISVLIQNDQEENLNDGKRISYNKKMPV